MTAHARRKRRRGKPKDIRELEKRGDRAHAETEKLIAELERRITENENATKSAHERATRLHR